MDDEIDYYPRGGKQEAEKGEYTKQINLLTFTRSHAPHYVSQNGDTAHFWNEQGLKAVFHLRKNFWTVSDSDKRVYGTAEQFLTWWHNRQPDSRPSEPIGSDTRQHIKALREIAAGKSVKEPA